MKRDRAESYAQLLEDFAPVKSPTESKPKKFALVCCDDEADTGWVTTHETLNNCVAQIEADDSEYAPSLVVDLDSGKSWEPEVEWTLEEGDPDYFSNEAPTLKEEEEETE